MTNAPIRPIRVIGIADKAGLVAPSREFVIWLEQQQRAVVAVSTVSSGFAPVSVGAAVAIDAAPVAVASAADAQLWPVMAADQFSDLGPVGLGCCDISALEPV
jgi:hypothetical protein